MSNVCEFSMFLDKKIMKIISSILMFVFMVVPILLFNHMTHMIDAHMMGDQECPYLSGSDSVCPMDFSIRLNALQNVIVTPFSKLVIVNFGILFLYIVCISLCIVRLNFYFKRERYRDIPIMFQELFSQGILNGKAF
jgi:hypothetical protein